MRVILSVAVRRIIRGFKSSSVLFQCTTLLYADVFNVMAP